MMHLKPTTPMLQYSNTPLLVALVILGLVIGCDRLPGKPTPKSAGGLQRKSQIFPNSTP